MSLKHALRLTAASSLSSVLPYTSYTVGKQEYLGTYDSPAEETAQQLRDRGYHYQLLAATKKHPEDGEAHTTNSASDPELLDDGSFVRIPSEHPKEASGTALERGPPRECQYHVHLFERPNDGNDTVVTELYGHYEVHPYPHVPHWDLSRTWPRHYRPTWDVPNVPRSEWTYLRGVLDDEIKDLLTNER